MKLIDTHTHLYSEQFVDDIDEVIARAVDQGIKEFYLPAIDSSYIKRMKELKIRFPENIQLMAGLHPTSAKANYLDELAIVERELIEGGYVAVGEIGIDLYWDESFLAQQQDAFSKQLAMSIEHQLPFVVHCRDAFDEVFEVLAGFNTFPHSGVFHCFTGSREQAKTAIDLGLYLGIGGVVTFKNGKIDQFLSELPIERIVLETDAPYLAPVPYRGKRNESAYLELIAQKVANLYGMSTEEVARITTLNARQIFSSVN
jgi:TatD DNase family protein